jgi:DNA-directed RNA polymerase specialized sigma24 family protein
VQELDYPELALILGVSEGTARVRAFRARALLREELGTVVDTVWIQDADPA